MTSISTAQHQAFCKAVKEELAKTGVSVALMDKKIEEYLLHMDKLRLDYMQHLKTLQSLVIQYEAAKKEARLLLRRRLAAHKHQVAKKTKTIGHPVSKAS